MSECYDVDYVVVVLLILLLARGCRFYEDVWVRLFLLILLLLLLLWLLLLLLGVLLLLGEKMVNLGVFTLFHCTVVCGKMSITLSFLGIC